MSTDGTLRAGASEVEITPPMGVEMCGYGPYEKRVCKEVLDPLFARALWLEGAEGAAVLITADLCMLDRSISQAVARALQKECGIAESAVLVAASHTHSGPATRPTIAWGEPDGAYVAGLTGRLVEAAVAARRAAIPATLRAGCVRVTGVGVNREEPALAPLDTAAQLIRLDRADGTPLAVVYNFGAHPVVRYPLTWRISADWPGLVAAYLAHKLDGAKALFLQGPCGDVNAHEMTGGREDAVLAQRVCDMRVGDVAARFADQVLPTLRALPVVEATPLASFWQDVELPCLPPDRREMQRLVEENQAAAESMTLDEFPPLHERLRAGETEEQRRWRHARWDHDRARRQLELLDRSCTTVSAPLHVLRLGPVAVVGWPAEVFVDLGLEVRRRSPFPVTFVATFANDTVGYVPTPAAYASKGRPNEFGVYPREMTPFIYGNPPFRSDVGRILVETTLAALDQLARRAAGGPSAGRRQAEPRSR